MNTATAYTDVFELSREESDASDDGALLSDFVIKVDLVDAQKEAGADAGAEGASDAPHSPMSDTWSVPSDEMVLISDDETNVATTPTRLADSTSVVVTVPADDGGDYTPSWDGNDDEDRVVERKTKKTTTTTTADRRTRAPNGTSYRCAGCTYRTRDRLAMRNHCVAMHGSADGHLVFACGSCEFVTFEYEAMWGHFYATHRSPSSTTAAAAASHLAKTQIVTRASSIQVTKTTRRRRRRSTTTTMAMYGAFSCGTCGKRCQTAVGLRQHEHIHNDNKPHACPHCPFRAALRNHLTNHCIKRHQTRVTSVEAR